MSNINEVTIVSVAGSSGTIEIEAGYLYGSVYNKGTAAINIEIDGVSIGLEAGMIYNLEYITKPYPATRIIAGVSPVDAVFHY